MKKIFLLPLFVYLFFNVLFAAEIPAEHIESIYSVVKKAFNVDKPESIEGLSGGFSSPGLYKISVKGKAYVVRFNNKDRSLEDRQREFDAMKISSDRGIAPKIICGDPQEGIIMMEFINGSQYSEHFNPLSDENLSLLGSGIRKIHEGPVFKETLSFFEVAKLFEGAIKGEKPLILIQASILIDKLQLELKDRLIKMPAHNDLNPNNIIYSEGKIYFIDWEAAGQADPFIDLATPIVLYGMDDKQEKIMLKAYFGRDLSSQEEDEFQKMKRVVRVYYGFALICVSQLKGEGLMSDEEIKALPSLQEQLKSDIRVGSPKDIQKFGFVFLLKAVME